MTDNTDEAHLDIPPDNQLENPPADITAANDPEPINSNQQTENMEVHHHPDIHHKPKKWKEYFLEFLMIFLAVTLGFFAESLREHIVNKEREKQYINSLYQDLGNDQKDLPSLITNIRMEQLEPAKALPHLLNKITTSTPADTIYYFFRYFIRQQGIRAFITDRTYEQIKNTGEMRLITEKQIADSVVDYYKDVLSLDYLQQTLLGYKAKLLDNLPTILKSSDYALAINISSDEPILPNQHLYLINANPLDVNRILIQVNEISGLSHTIELYTESLLKKNRNIQNLIQTKYQIERTNVE